MNTLRPNLFSRAWSSFQSWPKAGKAAAIGLVLLGMYAAGQDAQPAPRPSRAGNFNARNFNPRNFNPAESNQGWPGRNNMRPAGAPDSKSRALAQLRAQQQQMVASAQQCMAEMNRVSAANAARAMQGQMPVQAPCTQSMYQLNAQLAVVETEIQRLQNGAAGDVCSVTGYCAPTSTPGNSYGSGSSYRAPGDGTEAVERTSREGTLGQCIYRSDDGYETTQSCQGGDHYWQNVETGRFVNTMNQPNNRYDYRYFGYSQR